MIKPEKKKKKKKKTLDTDSHEIKMFVKQQGDSLIYTQNQK